MVVSFILELILNGELYLIIGLQRFKTTDAFCEPYSEVLLKMTTKAGVSIQHSLL